MDSKGAFEAKVKQIPALRRICRAAIYMLDDGGDQGFCSEPYWRDVFLPAVEAAGASGEADLVHSLLPDCRHEGECW